MTAESADQRRLDTLTDVHGTPATALEVCFCTRPVGLTRNCRNIILGSRIVEMGPYCSCVSVALGSHNFAETTS